MVVGKRQLFVLRGVCLSLRDSGGWAAADSRGIFSLIRDTYISMKVTEYLSSGEKNRGILSKWKHRNLSQGPVHCRRARISFCEFNQVTGIHFEQKRLWKREKLFHVIKTHKAILVQFIVLVLSLQVLIPFTAPALVLQSGGEGEALQNSARRSPFRAWNLGLFWEFSGTGNLLWEASAVQENEIALPSDRGAAGALQHSKCWSLYKCQTL